MKMTAGLQGLQLPVLRPEPVVLHYPALLFERPGVIDERIKGDFCPPVYSGRPLIIISGKDPSGPQDARDFVQRTHWLHPMETLRAGDDISAFGGQSDL